RDVVLAREVAHEPGRAAVHRLGVPRAPLGQVPLVLQADGAGVDVPVAAVPGDVARAHVLGDVAVAGTQGVVPAHVPRVADGAGHAVEGRLAVVDDDVVDPPFAGPPVVVAVAALAEPLV